MTRWVHGVSRDILRAAFREYFGVAEEHAAVLAVLYCHPGEWLKVKRLQILLDSHRPPKRQAVYERIRVLREAMEPESISSGGQLDDTGYALTGAGYRECAMALRVLAQALVQDTPVLTDLGGQPVIESAPLRSAIAAPSSTVERA
jgi:hypothetical protein